MERHDGRGHRTELRPARKTGADKEARQGNWYYLSKVKLRVIRYVQNAMRRGRDVQAGAARAWIDLGIMQLGHLAAARCRWIATGLQITVPEFISCGKRTATSRTDVKKSHSLNRMYAG